MTVVVDEVEVIPAEPTTVPGAAVPAAPDPADVVRRALTQSAVRRARAERLRAY
jgi:hypothetical protein